MRKRNTWKVFFHGDERERLESAPEDLVELLQSAARRPASRGRPFLVGPDGRPAGLLNDYFRSPNPGGSMTPSAARSYAYSIATFCSLLAEKGESWDTASEEGFRHARNSRLEPANGAGISDATWKKEFEAIKALYKWASARGVQSPLVPRADWMRRTPGDASFPSQARVKWFSTAAFNYWSDLALRGILPDGTEDSSFRGRNEQRDSSFAEALFRTGLRVQELGNLLLDTEWPKKLAPGRTYWTGELAGKIAKGGRARNFWVPETAITQVKHYVNESRGIAIARAQESGVYSKGRWRVVERQSSGRIRWRERDGRSETANVDALPPAIRQSLLVETEEGLAPMCIWLTEDGLPLAHERWNAIFTRGNERVLQLDLSIPPIRPHHLRHSFALRWFSVGSLLWLGRTVGLDPRTARQLRDEMGSEWYLVQTLLGHSHVETTRSIYLEPFRHLDIQTLLLQAEDPSTSDLLARFLRSDPRVHVMSNE